MRVQDARRDLELHKLHVLASKHWTVFEWTLPPFTLEDGRPMSAARGTVWRKWKGEWTVGFGDTAQGEIG